MSKNNSSKPDKPAPKIVTPKQNIGLGRASVKPTNVIPPKKK